MGAGYAHDDAWMHVVRTAVCTSAQVYLFSYCKQNAKILGARFCGDFQAQGCYFPSLNW